jgi:hypothetical protein
MPARTALILDDDEKPSLVLRAVETNGLRVLESRGQKTAL